jgi:tripartite-type tricarboxylate transporter receptor subunit TctC
MAHKVFSSRSLIGTQMKEPIVHFRKSFIAPFAALGAAVMLPVSNATADPVAEFFSGTTLTYIQASGATGGYAAYSRVVVKHLSRFIPGNPSIQIQFMPGAGGVKGANYMYNVAAKDGSVIGMPLNSLAMFQLLRPEGVRYDASKFHWLVGLAQLNSVIVAWHDAPATTIEEARQTEIIIGSTARSADNYQQPMLANALLGTRFRMVTGYEGTQEMNLAMERGETHGRMTFWVSMQTTNPEWIRDNKVVPLVQVGARPIKDLPGVPSMIDLAETDDDKAIVRLLHVSAALGRTLYAPPGVPAERAAALRKAAEALVQDAAFLEDAGISRIEIDATPGAEIESLVQDALATPPALIERYKKAVGLN